MGDAKNCGLISGRDKKKFLSSETSSTALGPTQPPIQWAHWDCFNGSFEVGVQIWPFTQPSAEVMRAWSHMSTDTLWYLTVAHCTRHEFYYRQQAYLLNMSINSAVASVWIFRVSFCLLVTLLRYNTRLSALCVLRDTKCTQPNLWMCPYSKERVWDDLQVFKRVLNYI